MSKDDTSNQNTRPAVAAGIIGHMEQREWLKRAIARKGAHAFLLYGTANIGKRTVAETVARNVLGYDPAHPLGEHPDVKLVEPDREGSRPVIGIDAAREVRAFLSTTPLSADRKIVLLDEAEYLTDAAANALLKSIEEPAGDALIFLIAADRRRVLPTIRSRTLPVRFTRVDDDVLRNGLRAMGHGAAAADRIVTLAAGRAGIALSLLDDPKAEEAAARRVKAIAQLLNASRMVRLVYAARAAAAGEEAVRALADQWLTVLQKAVRNDPGAKTPRQAARATLQFARQMNSTAVRPDLLLEQALLSW